MLWPVSTPAASTRSRRTAPRQTAITTPAGMPMPAGREPARPPPAPACRGCGVVEDARRPARAGRRTAEIEPEHVGEIGDVLHDDRPVEAELVAQGLDVLARRAFRHQEQAWGRPRAA